MKGSGGYLVAALVLVVGLVVWATMGAGSTTTPAPDSGAGGAAGGGTTGGSSSDDDGGFFDWAWENASDVWDWVKEQTGDGS